MGRFMRTAATASMLSSTKRNMAEANAIKQQSASQAQPVAPALVAAPAQSDLTVKLQELANLKTQGLITQEEFDAKKKQLLGL